MIPTRLLAVLGLVLSLYAVYVEHKMTHRSSSHSSSSAGGTTMEDEEPFHALCDIEAIGASCSAVFQRPEGKLLSFFGLIPVGHVLDVPNAVLGALYYAWLLLVPHFIPKEELGGNGGRDLVLLITRAMAALAFATTVVLAYCLTFVVYDLCLLCWTAHAINATLVYRLVWRGDTLDVRNDARSGSTPAKAKKA